MESNDTRTLRQNHASRCNHRTTFNPVKKLKECPQRKRGLAPRVRVLVVAPPAALAMHERSFPLGLYVAATCFKKAGGEVCCLDLTYSDTWRNQLSHAIDGFHPDIIGISVCSYSSYIGATHAIQAIRQYSDIPVILGGQHICGTLHFAKSERDVWYYIGYLEGAADALMTYVRNSTNARGGILNRYELVGHLCNSLIGVSYDLVEDLDKYIPTIELSRGCSGHCTFCNAPSPDGYICKTAQQLAVELQALADRVPAHTTVFIGGSNFEFSKETFASFSRMFSEYSGRFSYVMNLGVGSDWQGCWKYLQRLPIRHLFIGIESGSESTLRRMGKTSDPKGYLRQCRKLVAKCQSSGIPIMATFIYGFPGDNLCDIEATDTLVLSLPSGGLVAAGMPSHIYPGSILERNWNYIANQYGVSKCNSYDGSMHGFFGIDLGQQLTYEYLRLRALHFFSSINQDASLFYKCRGYRNYLTYESFFQNRFQFSEYGGQ